jgi:hypothetical protein
MYLTNIIYRVELGIGAASCGGSPAGGPHGHNPPGFGARQAGFGAPQAWQLKGRLLPPLPPAMRLVMLCPPPCARCSYLSNLSARSGYRKGKFYYECALCHAISGHVPSRAISGTHLHHQQRTSRPCWPSPSSARSLAAPGLAYNLDLSHIILNSFLTHNPSQQELSSESVRRPAGVGPINITHHPPTGRSWAQTTSSRMVIPTSFPTRTSFSTSSAPWGLEKPMTSQAPPLRFNLATETCFLLQGPPKASHGLPR